MIEEIGIGIVLALTIPWRDLVKVVGEDGGDAAIVEGTDGQCPGRDALGPLRRDAAIESQDAEAGAEALLGVRPVGEHGRDEPYGVGADALGPAAEALG